MRIAIVIPSGTLVHTQFALSLAAMVAHLHRVEVAFVNPKSSLVAASRNRGIRAALDLSPDHILFLDSDMSFPPDALERLISADKDIVGANYVMRNQPHKSLAIPLGREAQYVSGLVEVEGLPGGLVLLNPKVFHTMEQPWFETPPVDGGELKGEDYHFFDKARALGFEVWLDCDLSLQVVHWGDMGFRWRMDGTYEMVEV